MMKHFATTFSLFTFLSMCWGQGPSTEMLLTEAPCVNVHSDMVQHDVVVRLVVPPLTNLDVPPQNVQLGRSDGQLLPFWQGQVWADSTELWVRFDSLDTEEELLFFFLPNPNTPTILRLFLTSTTPLMGQSWTSQCGPPASCQARISIG